MRSSSLLPALLLPACLAVSFLGSGPMAADEVTPRIPGRLLGLCIGVGAYEHPSLDLPYPAADAGAVSGALRSQQGVYEDVQVTTLTDAGATVYDMRSALDRIVASARKPDTVFLYLGGHCWRIGERDYFFSARETDPTDDRTLARTTLPWSDISGRLPLLAQRVRRIVIVLDPENAGRVSTRELPETLSRAGIPVAVVGSLRPSRTRETSRRCYFARSLVELLTGSGEDGDRGTVTQADFITHLRRRLPQLTDGGQEFRLSYELDFETDAPLFVARRRE